MRMTGPGCPRLFLALLVLLVGACASQPKPVTDSVTPIQKDSFSILAPSGPHWYIADEAPSGVLFWKVDPSHYKNRNDFTHTFGLVAGMMPGGSLDISTPEGLMAAAESQFRGEDPSRFKVVDRKLDPFNEQGTDCLRMDLAYEEMNNPHIPETVLLMNIYGKVCRHPYKRGMVVMVTYSERRPRGHESMLDDTLRAECEHSVNSVRFTGPN